jgi:hypothetical protein
MIEELLIKKSKSEKFFGYVFTIFSFLLGGYLLIINHDLRGIILVILSPILYYFHKRQYKTDEIIIRINALGIETQVGFSPWEKVDHVKIKYNTSNKRILEIYTSTPFDPDQSIDISNINCTPWKLRKHLKKYTVFKSPNF